MTRAFGAAPIDPERVEDILDAARRAPSAGFTQGVDLVVLEGAATARFWDVSLPPGQRREEFWWPTLLDAPLLIIPVCEPDAYVRRYAEPDKAVTGLGASRDRWPVAYWTVDAAFAAMALQYAAVDAGLGVLFFGIPGPWAPVLAALGVPDGYEAIGAVAIGESADAASAPSGSPTRRPRRAVDDVVHRGGW
ncbi:MAG: hypothetical protein QOE63_1543 [Acidimicrobiaceae bacterium]